jgi:hypothetical protein
MDGEAEGREVPAVSRHAWDEGRRKRTVRLFSKKRIDMGTPAASTLSPSKINQNMGTEERETSIWNQSNHLIIYSIYNNFPHAQTNVTTTRPKICFFMTRSSCASNQIILPVE